MASETSPVFAASTAVEPVLASGAHLHVAPGLRPLPFCKSAFVPFLLAAGDGAVVQFSYSLARAARYALAPWWPIVHTPGNGVGLRAGLLLTVFGCYLAGLYPGYGLCPVERLRRRVITIAVILGGLLAWEEMVYNQGWSRAAMLLTCALSAVFAPGAQELLIAFLIRVGRWGTPAVVLSTSHAGTSLARTLRRRPELGLVPVALFKNTSALWGHCVDEIPVIGPTSIAAEFSARIPVAVVAMPGISNTEMSRLLEHLPFRSVIVIPEFAALQSLWVSPRDLGGTLGLELTRNLLRKHNYYLKRLIDYVVGVPLFLLSVPLIAVLAAWIKSVSPGPVFYTQEREGRRGKLIRVWKLRTMCLDAEGALKRHLAANPGEQEQWSRFFKLKSDPRIIPGVGTLLRRTSLDELPQLWNVLRGDLSLVGPRPFPTYHTKSFGDDFRGLRSSVLPGITGFWQVSARSDGDLTMQEQLDTYYIRNWSLWLDGYIIARTVAVVMRCTGAY
jgi:Undecaprenyl-phosphate galactose phosphotransferase WbaP